MRDEWCAVFDRALRLRDAGVFDEGIETLRALNAVLDPVDERPLLLQSLLQIAHMHRELDNLEAAEMALRRATRLSPKSELASLALFHTLWSLGRNREALLEMQRYVELKPNSEGYRELLEGGYDADRDEEQELLERVHARLLKFN
jgi:tetratricopeptide (TPR) repeat protein